MKDGVWEPAVSFDHEFIRSSWPGQYHSYEIIPFLGLFIAVDVVGQTVKIDGNPDIPPLILMIEIGCCMGYL